MFNGLAPAKQNYLMIKVQSCNLANLYWWVTLATVQLPAQAQAQTQIQLQAQTQIPIQTQTQTQASRADIVLDNV